MDKFYLTVSERVELMIVGMALRKEHEVGGHITSTVRKQKTDRK